MLRLKVKCVTENAFNNIRLQGRECNINVQHSSGLDTVNKQYNYATTFGETVEIILPKEYSGFEKDGTGVIKTLFVSAHIDFKSNSVPGFRGTLNFSTKPDPTITHAIKMEEFYIEVPEPIIEPPLPIRPS